MYTGRRQTCEQLADLLCEAGVDAVAYHAGLDPARRAALQRDFCGGEARARAPDSGAGMATAAPQLSTRLRLHCLYP